MTTFESSAPAFKAALLTALQARSGLSGVTVSYGAPAGGAGAREFVALADIDGTQEYATLGATAAARRKDETFTMTVYCSVLREGQMQQECTERAFALAAEVEDAVREDPEVGGTVRVAEVASPFSLEEFASDQARQSVVTLGITATRRF